MERHHQTADKGTAFCQETVHEDQRSGFLKGKILAFSDGDELYHFFLDKEYEMHPDTLKARSRRSAEDSKAARQKELADKAAHRQRKLEQRAREAALEEQNNKKA